MRKQTVPSGVTFREPTEADILAVARAMRPADRREVSRWTAQPPETALRHSVAASDFCRAALFRDNAIAAIFGACRANLVERTGVLWSLSTSAVDAHRADFLRASREALALVCRALPDVDEFQNFTDLSYSGAVRWIEWLGGSFSIRPPVAGLRGGAFGRFFIANPFNRRDP